MIVKQEAQDVVMGPPIIPSRDNPIPLKDLAKHYKVNYKTFYSWQLVGRMNPCNQRVKLRTVKSPSGLSSTHKAFAEFQDLVAGINPNDEFSSSHTDWSKHHFIIDNGHAIFRFSNKDLRWMVSQMKPDDALRFEFSKALEELA